jgi:hypothetical protein
MDSSANNDRKKQTGKENIFPDHSGIYNVDIKKGMIILKRKGRRIYRNNFRYKSKK